jgi:D-sedoheptulose 7-phosphate isomerase
MMVHDIARYMEEVSGAVQRIAPRRIARVAEILTNCHRDGGTVFVLGNGGSAATASHFVCDLSKGTRVDGRPTFRVLSLTDNTALLTAWANDTSYDRVFAEQLTALVRPGDAVVVMSCSGTSPNVLAAARVARDVGATVIGLTGRSGGRLLRLAHLAICVPSDTVEVVEDAHLMIAHSVCVALREQRRSEAAAQG